MCNPMQYCWKLLHPTNEYDNKECPKDAEAYEKVRDGHSHSCSLSDHTHTILFIQGRYPFYFIILETLFKCKHVNIISKQLKRIDT